MTGLRELLDAATPGPWEYDGFEHVVSPEITDIVCGLWQRPGADGVPDPQMETDARLIALAPELARLCLDMGHQLERWRNAAMQRDTYLEAIPEAVETADALLARLDRIGKEEA